MKHLPLIAVDDMEQKVYDRMPVVDEAVASHLCPPAAIGWKFKATHPSKPCRTSASASQAASALHTMTMLQVFQAKLHCTMEEAGHDPATFKELCSATDLACVLLRPQLKPLGV